MISDILKPNDAFKLEAVRHSFRLPLQASLGVEGKVVVARKPMLMIGSKLHVSPSSISQLSDRGIETLDKLWGNFTRNLLHVTNPFTPKSREKIFNGDGVGFAAMEAFYKGYQITEQIERSSIVLPQGVTFSPLLTSPYLMGGECGDLSLNIWIPELPEYNRPILMSVQTAVKVHNYELPFDAVKYKDLFVS